MAGIGVAPNGDGGGGGIAHIYRQVSYGDNLEGVSSITAQFNDRCCGGSVALAQVIPTPAPHEVRHATS